MSQSQLDKDFNEYLKSLKLHPTAHIYFVIDYEDRRQVFELCNELITQMIYENTYLNKVGYEKILSVECDNCRKIAMYAEIRNT